MIDLGILGALFGLAGAISNNGKTENTDRLVRQALLSGDSTGMIDRIHQEKDRISPGCTSCRCPCGNTSDYDTSRFAFDDAGTAREKKKVMELLYKKAEEAGEDALPEIVYRAIAYLGYELEEASYRELRKEMEQ